MTIYFQDIEEGKYRIVTINPEILMNNPNVDKLWKKPQFTKKILNFIFDEGHCISQWGAFWKEYLQIGALCYLIPESIPFYIPLATLPPIVLSDIVDILRLRPNKTEYIIRSNDRPEINLVVRSLNFPANSFKDLAFLISEGYCENDEALPKFLIFFDNRMEAEKACFYLQSRLPQNLKQMIKWFHSLNTGEYRTEELENMKTDKIWGFCSTDSFGMVSLVKTFVKSPIILYQGMDLSDIKLIIQWKANCDMCALWQRFGRGGQCEGQNATAILLVEKKDTDEERAVKVVHDAKRKDKKKEGTGTKRKALDQLNHTSKRPALTNASPRVNRNAQDLNLEELENNLIAANDTTDLQKEAYEERRAHYSKSATSMSIPTQPLAQTTKGKGREGVEVGSVMDDFINAKQYFNCRRAVPMLFFGNDKTREFKLQTSESVVNSHWHLPMLKSATNDHILCNDKLSSG